MSRLNPEGILSVSTRPQENQGGQTIICVGMSYSGEDSIEKRRETLLKFLVQCCKV